MSLPAKPEAHTVIHTCLYHILPPAPNKVTWSEQNQWTKTNSRFGNARQQRTTSCLSESTNPYFGSNVLVLHETTISWLLVRHRMPNFLVSKCEHRRSFMCFVFVLKATRRLVGNVHRRRLKSTSKQTHHVHFVPHTVRFQLNSYSLSAATSKKSFGWQVSGIAFLR